MATTVATLKALAILDATGLVEGLDLTKKEMREAAKVAEAATDSMTRLAQEQAKLTRFAKAGFLDPSQFRTAMEQAEQRFIPLAELVPERTIAKLDAAGLKVNTLSKDVTDLKASAAGLGIGFNPATAGLAAFAVASGAAAAGVAFIGDTIKERMAAIDALGDRAQQLGVSAGALSKLQTMGALGVTSPEAVSDALQKMLVNVGKGDEGFAKLGLSVEALRAAGPVEMFGAIADKISDLPSRAEKMSALVDVFGKSSPEMLDMIERFDTLQQKAIDTGAVVSDDLARRVGEAADAFDELKLRTDGLGNSLASLAAGPLKAWAEGANAIVSDTSALEDYAGTWGSLIGLLGGVTAGATLGMGARNIAGVIGGERDRLKEEALKAGKAIGGDFGIAGGIDLGTGDNPFAEAAAQRQHDLIMRGLEEEERERQEMARREKERLAELSAERDKRFEEDKRRFQEGKRVLDDLRDPKEKIEDDLKEKLLALERAGLDSDEARGKLFGRAAKDMLGLESGGFGAPGADKGTRAAREAVIMSSHQAEQTQLLKRIEKHLEKINAKPVIEVEEIS